MIISSGQILTGRAAATITNGITNAKDANGYVRTAYKAVCTPDTMPTEDSGVNGTWVVEGASGKDDNFVGVIGDDSMPEANLGAADALGNREPVLDWGASRTYQVGDVLTFERNGMISVIAGEDIAEGDWLKLGDNGTFVKASGPTRIGRAYESAAAGERFGAMIGSL